MKIVKITLAEDENKHKCSSYTLYIVLFSTIVTINIGIGVYFVYFHWYLKKDATCVNNLINLKMGEVKNRDQKSNFLFLQGHDQSQKSGLILIKNRQKA